MRKALIIAASCAAFLPSAAIGQGVNAAASARQVSVEVREAGRVVATSSVTLQLGRQAAINLDGPYSMRLRVDAVEGEGYTVRPKLTANGPAGWTPLSAPSLSVAHGQQGKTKVERPSGPPLEIAVLVD